MADDDKDVVKIAESIAGYADVSGVAHASVLRSAKLENFLRHWGKENAIDAFAIQCWTSIQANYGVCSCTTMSRFGDEGMPSACEADILGTLSMHACMLASGSPAALADWNNLHNDDEVLVNVWHCGVFPASFAKEKPKLGVPGDHRPRQRRRSNYPGDSEVSRRVRGNKPGPLTLSRATQDPDGSWKVAIAEGALEDNPAVTFGSYGWCRIPGLQRFYRDVLLAHFPHHTSPSPKGIAATCCGKHLASILDSRFTAGTAPAARSTRTFPF